PVDRIVGTREIDAAEGPEQQHPDQTGLDVRNESAHHQHHDEREHRKRLWRLPRGGQHLTALDWQAEQDQIVSRVPQRIDLLPGPEHEQRVADAQGLVQMAVGSRGAPASEAEYREDVISADSGPPNRLAHQRRIRTDQDLRHTKILRSIEEEGFPQWKLRQGELPEELAQVAVGIEAIDEQDIAVLEGRLLCRTNDLVCRTDDLDLSVLRSLDRQDVDSVGLA